MYKKYLKYKTKYLNLKYGGSKYAIQEKIVGQMI